MMTLCQCCFGSLKKADSLLKEQPSLREEVNGTLEKEGLSYEGKIEIKHLLSVLYHEVGIASIQKKIGRTYRGLRVATHYGCHALRPSQVVGFDNPVAPSLFDQLVEATGAESIDWSMKLECCGAPLWGTNDELSMDLTQKKLKDGKQSGADYLCVACPWCQIQFDTVQKQIIAQRGFDPPLPSLLYPQLLGLSMGIDEAILGLRMNRVPTNGIDQWFAEEDASAKKEETSARREDASAKKEEAPAKKAKPINRPKDSTEKDA